MRKKVWSYQELGKIRKLFGAELKIITCEEHTVIGGLGDAVAMTIQRKPAQMHRIGINDVFGESGEANELLEKYGLTAENIAKVAKEMINS